MRWPLWRASKYDLRGGFSGCLAIFLVFFLIQVAQTRNSFFVVKKEKKARKNFSLQSFFVKFIITMTIVS